MHVFGMSQKQQENPVWLELGLTRETETHQIREMVGTVEEGTSLCGTLKYAIRTLGLTLSEMTRHWTILSRGESRPNLCLVRITLTAMQRENYWLCCAVLSRSVVSDSFVTPWTVALRLLCPWGFSRQEYWSALPCPPPGDLPNPGTEPLSPSLQEDSLPLSYQGSPNFQLYII